MPRPLRPGHNAAGREPQREVGREAHMRPAPRGFPQDVWPGASGLSGSPPKRRGAGGLGPGTRPPEKFSCGRRRSKAARTVGQSASCGFRRFWFPLPPRLGFFPLPASIQVPEPSGFHFPAYCCDTGSRALRFYFPVCRADPGSRGRMAFRLRRLPRFRPLAAYPALLRMPAVFLKDRLWEKNRLSPVLAVRTGFPAVWEPGAPCARPSGIPRGPPAWGSRGRILPDLPEILPVPASRLDRAELC
jgi:hypothetical protein